MVAWLPELLLCMKNYIFEVDAADCRVVLFVLINSLAIIYMFDHCKISLKGIIIVFIIPENTKREHIIISIHCAKSCKMVANT